MSIYDLQKIGYELRYEDDKNFISEIIKWMNEGCSLAMSITHAVHNKKEIFGNVNYIRSQKNIVMSYRVINGRNWHDFQKATIEEFWESLYSFMIVYSVNSALVKFDSGSSSRFSKEYVKEQMNMNSMPHIS